jgi:hypothetical protein
MTPEDFLLLGEFDSGMLEPIAAAANTNVDEILKAWIAAAERAGLTDEDQQRAYVYALGYRKFFNTLGPASQAVSNESSSYSESQLKFWLSRLEYWEGVFSPVKVSLTLGYLQGGLVERIPTW